MSEARSPTALASVTCAETVFTDWSASSGDITPERIRCSSSSTSNDRASNRSVKKASASSGVPAGYCPTGPLAVGGADEDVPVPVDATPLVHRPLAHHCGMVVNARSADHFPPATDARL